MRFKLSIMLLFGIMAVFYPAFSQETSSVNMFTLDDCIAYALENNQSVKNAVLDIESAKGRVGETLADGLPQINGNVDLAYNYKVPRSFVPAILFDENAPVGQFVAVEFGTKYSGSASISLSQMIFDGSYFVGLQAARTFQELSRKDHIKTKIDVVEAVKKAYYSTLVTRERAKLVDANYQRLDTLLRETQLMYENGFAEKIDVSRVKVEFNNIKVEKSRIEQTLVVSYYLLKFQMGMPAEGEELQLKETIADIEFQLLSEAVSESFRIEDRIEYSQLQTNRELVGLDIKNNKVQYIPRLDLYGSLGANSGAQTTSDLFDFENNWFGLGTVGLRMNVPIFDGLRKSRRIQQKRVQQVQIENSMVQLENSINVEIKQAKVNYQTGVENMNAQKENMALAEDIYNVTKIKYQEGVGPNIDVIDADTSFKQAQTNYYSALYDALVAKVELEKAYGKLLEN